jgi:hypothetical protein
MNSFSKLGGTSGVSPNSSGVWRIEKKRKVRDPKKRQQNKLKKESRNKEEDDSVLLDIEIDDTKNEECEDQSAYGYKKPKKSSLCSRVDLKI